MRTLLLAALAASLLASGCGNACQDLGERLCKCKPAGTTKSSCVQDVKSEISNLDPSKSDQEKCEEKLDTCNAPEDVDFCDWLDGRCGKAACGMSEEILVDLQAAGTCP